MLSVKRPPFPEWLTSVFLVLMLSIFPLYTGSYGYEGITTAKYSLFLALCGGYVVLMALLGIEMLFMGQAKLPNLKRLIAASSLMQKFVILYLLFTIGSSLFSIYSTRTIIGMTRYEGSLTIGIYCLCFLLVSVFAKPKAWMLIPFGITVTLFCVICFMQLVGLNPLVLYPKGYGYHGAFRDYSGEFLGTIGNVDLVAAFFCIVLPVMLFSLVRLSGRIRFLLLIPLFLSVVVLVWSHVYAGLLGSFCGIVIALPLLLRVSPRMRKLFYLFLLAFVFAGLCTLYFVDFGSGPLWEAREILHGRISDAFGSKRVYIWRQVLLLVPQHFWFGAGPDTMSAAGIEGFTRNLAQFDTTVYATIDTAHNEYLNILFHQGIFAFLSYLLALIFAAVHWVKQRQDNGKAICGAAVLCYLLSACFGLSMCLTAPFLWLSLALLCHQTGGTLTT